MGRRWGVTCLSRLTSPPETPLGELVSQTSPSSPLLVPREGQSLPCSPLISLRGPGFTRRAYAEAAWKRALRCHENGEVKEAPGEPGLPFLTKHTLVLLCLEKAQMGCHSVTLTCLTYRPCCLPRNLSQQAGWAGFAKLKAGKAWVWVAWYTVGTVYMFS